MYFDRNKLLVGSQPGGNTNLKSLNRNKNKLKIRRKSGFFILGENIFSYFDFPSLRALWDTKKWLKSLAITFSAYNFSSTLTELFTKLEKCRGSGTITLTNHWMLMRTYSDFWLQHVPVSRTETRVSNRSITMQICIRNNKIKILKDGRH